MADTDGQRKRGGWRWLGVFWLTVLALMAIGGGVLQWLGPPGPGRSENVPPPHEASAIPAVPFAAADRGTAIVVAKPATQERGLVVPVVVGRDTPGPIADPDPALLEPLAEGSKQNLPRIASDGRTAMQVYAAGFDHSSRRPRVGLLLGGIGLNEVDSDAAIRNLPGAVSLAVSPYATNLTRLLATARASGHEYLIEIPLEPTGFPLNDPGPHTLLTSQPAAANIQNLHWTMSRIDGYAGATGVIGTMRGERLAAMNDQMEAVLSELSERGLFYVDPRQGGPRQGDSRQGDPRQGDPRQGDPRQGDPRQGIEAVSKAWGRHVDLVIDDPADRGVADRTMIDAKLAELEQRAKDTGSALGLVMLPTPVTVARIAAWSNGLGDRGLALAPTSALALPPANVPVKLSEREH